MIYVNIFLSEAKTLIYIHFRLIKIFLIVGERKIS